MSLLYRFLRFIIRPLFKLAFWYRIKKTKTKIPDGGCLICSNHISAIDPVFLGLGLKRQLRFLAKSELEKAPVLGRLLKKFGITVRRGTADISAMKAAIGTLSDGNLLCVFPQGTRRKGLIPAETEIKSGSGMMACYSKCSVVPAYIYAKGYRLKPFCRLKITFGEPIKYEELGFEKNNKAEIDAASKLIWDRICELAPEKKEG